MREHAMDAMIALQVYRGQALRCVCLRMCVWHVCPERRTLSGARAHAHRVKADNAGLRAEWLKAVREGETIQAAQ
jgi:hypothetical protein